MWRFVLVIEVCGIIQLSTLSLLHTTLCFLLHLCFGESFDKEDCFWNSQCSLWMIGIKNFITKGVYCVFVSFVCNSQGQIFLLSFHLWSSSLYINYLLFIKQFFLVARCGLWDLVPWPGIESRPPSVEAWCPNHWTTRKFPTLCRLLMFNLSQIFYFGQKYFMGEYKTLEVNIASRIWVCLIYFV